MGSIFFPLIEASLKIWFPRRWNIRLLLIKSWFIDSDDVRQYIGYCVTEFETVFHGLVFWRFLLASNKNTRQMFYSGCTNLASFFTWTCKQTLLYGIKFTHFFRKWIKTVFLRVPVNLQIFLTNKWNSIHTHYNHTGQIKKISVLRVTRPYLNLLVNPWLFSRLKKNIILCFLKGKMPFKMHKIIFSRKNNNKKKYECLPYLKFSNLLPKTHLFFYFATVHVCKCLTSYQQLRSYGDQAMASLIRQTGGIGDQI